MDSFDYIIVGAGSAGCVLASRLSENPNTSVCLLETGKKDSHPAIHIPFGLALMSHLPSINYDFETSPEPLMNNREMYWPRGKTLGGSSSVNAMCYIRGNPANYDNWAKNGARGWDWQSVLPYFKKSENNTRGSSIYHGRKKLFGHGFTIHFCNLYPKSRGSISLVKENKQTKLKINVNYLQEESDLAPMIAGYKWSQKVATIGPLGKYSSAFIPQNDLQTDAEIIEYIKENAESVYHPVGTCKMGAVDDPTSVVDSHLKVIGVARLRVVDASIMPTIIGGNTNAPTIMIAEKAADLIKQTKKLNTA